MHKHDLAKAAAGSPSRARDLTRWVAQLSPLDGPFPPKPPITVDLCPNVAFGPRSQCAEHDTTRGNAV